MGKLERLEARECLPPLPISPHELRPRQQHGGADEVVTNSSGHHCLDPARLRSLRLPPCALRLCFSNLSFSERQQCAVSGSVPHIGQPAQCWRYKVLGSVRVMGSRVGEHSLLSDWRYRGLNIIQRTGTRGQQSTIHSKRRRRRRRVYASRD